MLGEDEERKLVEAATHGEPVQPATDSSRRSIRSLRSLVHKVTGKKSRDG